MMQINLTGFLGGSKARLFIGELWNILASAQSSPDGIPPEFVEMKKKELLKRQVQVLETFLKENLSNMFRRIMIDCVKFANVKKKVIDKI